MIVLKDVCEGRDNNLNLIRMSAAVGVLVSHAWPLSLGPGTSEPLSQVFGQSLGSLSVLVFFVISGFLIPRSFERQPTLVNWLRARCLRLAPALVVVLLLTVLVLGPLITTLPLADYARRPETLTYVPCNLSLAFLQPGLPGVFGNNPYPRAINGSLWTLFYEVVCYGGVMVVGVLGILRSRLRMGIALALFVLVYAAVTLTPLRAMAPDRLLSLLRLGLPFAIGTGFYVWRARLVLHPGVLLGLAGLTLLAWNSVLSPVLFVLSLCYAVFLLAYLPGGLLRCYNRLGDYSYGTYVYAFPVQQLTAFLFAPMDPLSNIAIALPVTLVLAVLSWTRVERPALVLARSSARRGAAAKA